MLLCKLWKDPTKLTVHHGVLTKTPFSGSDCFVGLFGLKARVDWIKNLKILRLSKLSLKNYGIL